MNDIKKICNATNLKYLAVALMFLDQIYQMFGSMGAPIWLTMLGRLVFPIFLFASVVIKWRAVVVGSHRTF